MKLGRINPKCDRGLTMQWWTQYSGVWDIARKGKMVPKGNSQRYCYENEEQNCGMSNKREKCGNKKKCQRWEEFLGPPLSERWNNSWRKSFLFFFWWPNFSRPKQEKTSRVMTTRGSVKHGADLISNFMEISTNETEDSWSCFMITLWFIKDQHCYKAMHLKWQKWTDTTPFNTDYCFSMKLFQELFRKATS